MIGGSEPEREADMVLEDVYEFTEDGLRRRRATSVQNVNKPTASSHWSSKRGMRVMRVGEADRKSPYLKCGGAEKVSGYLRYISV